MKKLLYILILLSCILLSSCGNDNQNPEIGTGLESDLHIHTYKEWIVIQKPSCTTDGINERYCDCGEKQVQNIMAYGHVEVVDSAISATCITDGKTEGKHCAVCNEVLIAQITVDKLGHTEVVIPSVPATCTTDGKTEGRSCSVCNEVLVSQTIVRKFGHTEVIDVAVSATCTNDGKTEGHHCSVCNTVFVAQSAVPATGHDFSNISILSNATCIKEGLKQISCRNCSYNYTESYNLKPYTATEISSQALNYVGEIITYDKNGNSHMIGTGFVYSCDGKIITNFHVLDGAYSAVIVIDGVTYQVREILAYDENIDLAVIKVDGTFSNYANICKNEISVGTTIYAIGSSRGLTNTFSQGIVTYYNRVVDDVSYIQHDASITNGNSGGPLINEYGEVIGINTWGITDSQNLNFAVFVKELDNLKFGAPKTLGELYKEKNNAYENLLNWVIENYNYTSNGNIEYQYKEPGELFSVYSLTYFSDSKLLSLIHYYVFDNEDSRYVSIRLSKDSSSYSYYATYTDGEWRDIENVTKGSIYPATFTRYTPIECYSSEGGSWTSSSLLDTYQEGIVYSIDWFSDFLKEANLGLSLSDFGFNSFY